MNAPGIRSWGRVAYGTIFCSGIRRQAAAPSPASAKEAPISFMN